MVDNLYESLKKKPVNIHKLPKKKNNKKYSYNWENTEKP